MPPGRVRSGLMKKMLPLLAGAAAIAVAVSFWSPAAQAQQPAATEGLKSPVGQPCVVTLDPLAERVLGPVKESLEKTGLTPEGTVEGTLISMDREWVVLKDGTYESWIPRDKVLLIRASR